MKKTILYVDDEDVNVLLFKAYFENMFNLHLVKDVDAAIELINNIDNIDYVFSDYKMPIMNGVQFIKKVKEYNSNIPCILISAYNIKEIIKLSKDDMSFVDDYIQKPYTRESVINKVNTIKNN